ncbi:MAG: 30S ribosomal protein S9 [Spirochaetia bacterium]
MAENLALATGRRKNAVARVYLRQGNGTITVNGHEASSYFGESDNLFMVNQPLDVTNALGTLDIMVKVRGGGKAGQAGAIRHGLSRALVKYDETNYATLRENGFMTRDPRMTERKKYGQPGARKKFQFSKR